MISSTVYAWEDQLEQISGVLDGYGYDVLNSHIGTIAPAAGSNNLRACLAAVERCDYFLGVIRGYYGSGKQQLRGLSDNEISITHMEQRLAIQLQKPRSFLVEEKVATSRQLLRPLLGVLRPNPKDVNGVLQWDFPAGSDGPKHLKGNAIIDDLRVLAMYEEALLSETAPAERHDHWCQSFHRLADVLKFVEARFADEKVLRAELRALQVRAAGTGPNS